MKYTYIILFFRETKKELNFIESAHSCLGNHYSKTPYTGLIPVGKLRCLRNRFEYNSSTFRLNEDNICGRNFRVNAIKDNRGVWREYPTGNDIGSTYFFQTLLKNHCNILRLYLNL